ncbi:MAG: LCP family protein, partial [Terrisporobacter sp.]
KTKKIVISLLLILIIVPVSLAGYVYFRLTKANQEIEEKGITNILLLGTDGREGEASYRSDCMMILTIDNDHKSVKVTSLARDTYVDIPNQGKGKLNASYFWGKDQLLFKTIKSEFGIDIDKYVQIDFEGLVDVINLLDGIEIDLTEAEAKAIKAPGAGVQTLTGEQAISYCRVRDIDNAIYRDGRQRKVILSVASKAMSLSVKEYPKVIETFRPFVTTNIGNVELLAMAQNMRTIISESGEIKQGQFPIIDDVHVKGGSYKDAGWVWLYDKNSVVVLQQFIFDDINMSENKYLNDNSKIELNY